MVVGGANMTLRQWCLVQRLVRNKLGAAYRERHGMQDSANSPELDDSDRL